MRVARLIARMNIGGPSRSVVALTRALVDRGDATEIWTGEGESREGDFLEGLRLGVPVVRIRGLSRSLSPTKDASAFFHVRRELKRFRPEILHTHTAKAGALGRLASLSLGRVSPKLVHTFHGHVLSGNFGRSKQMLYRGVERFLAKRTDRMIAVAERVRDELVEEFGVGRSEQYSVIPGGVDELSEPSLDREEARLSLGIRGDGPLIGVVARLARVKGHAILFNAWKQTTKRPRLALLGDGPERFRLESMAKECGVPAFFCGWIETPRRFMKAFDVVVLPSFQEGLPLALLEAMSESVPVIATAVGGVPDLIDDAVNGRLIAPADVCALAKAIDDMLNNPTQSRIMGAEGKKATEAYTWENHIRRVFACYDDLLR